MRNYNTEVERPVRTKRANWFYLYERDGEKFQFQQYKTNRATADLAFAKHTGGAEPIAVNNVGF